MTADALTCKELVDIVTDYLEGRLPPDARTRFERHLATCDGCTNYLDQMRRTIDLTGRLTEESIDPETERALLQIFRRWKEG
jgi:anti-sigma factor RsiW